MRLQDLPGLKMDRMGIIEVSCSMGTSLENVWAAGDIVSFPLTTYGDRWLDMCSSPRFEFYIKLMLRS